MSFVTPAGPAAARPETTSLPLAALAEPPSRACAVSGGDSVLTWAAACESGRGVVTPAPAPDSWASEIVRLAATMPEFAGATEDQLRQVARVISAARSYARTADIAAHHRANPPYGSAITNGSTAGAALGDSGQQTAPGDDQRVWFRLTGPAIRRDIAIWNALERVRQDSLALPQALMEGLRACATFGADVSLRVYCYSQISPADLQVLREMKPILEDPELAALREFECVKRVVLGGEQPWSIVTQRIGAISQTASIRRLATELAAGGRSRRAALEDEAERTASVQQVQQRQLDQRAAADVAANRARAEASQAQPGTPASRA